MFQDRNEFHEILNEADLPVYMGKIEVDKQWQEWHQTYFYFWIQPILWFKPLEFKASTVVTQTDT